MRVLNFLLLLTVVFAVHASIVGSYVNEEHNFHHLILAQFWSPSSCVYFKSEGKGCAIPANVTGWTIHGLWPSIPGAEKPVYCNDSWKFDFSEIAALQPRLQKDWPYVCKEGKRTTMWEHEWTKHGTCASSLPFLRGQFRYFNQTLDLHAKLNTLKVLQDAQIVPSKSRRYKLMDIFNAVRKGYGGRIPNIFCLKDTKTRSVHLEQILLCFDKSLKPIDCPQVAATADRRQAAPLYFKSMKDQVPNIESYFQDCNNVKEVLYTPLHNHGDIC